MSVLDNTSLPLWLWIVVFVVGSLCVVGAIGVVLICMLRRNKRGEQIEDAPTRKMTVRRGRVVPASHYLSLTGSKFGLNQFDDDARANGARSKSPFEWWNTIKEKRRSHHGETLHFDSPESKARLRDISRPGSNTGLYEEKEPVVREVHLEEPSPTPPTGRVPSFSRPLPAQPDDPSPIWAQPSHRRDLSMIKEASPHVSMVSSRSLERRSSRLSTYNPGESTRRERRSSNHEGRRPSHPRTNDSHAFRHKSRKHSEARGDPINKPHHESRQYSKREHPAESRSRRRPSQTSQYQSDGGLSRQYSQTSTPSVSTRPSPVSSRRPSARSSSSIRRPSHPSPIDSSAVCGEIPRPVAYRGSRHSLGEQDMTNASTSTSKRNSLVSRGDGMTDYPELSRKPSRPKSLLLDDAPPQDAGYYASRAEMMPAEKPPAPPTPTTPTGPSRSPSIGRSSSKKGNVLRKKSIKRQEVVSFVGA